MKRKIPGSSRLRSLFSGLLPLFVLAHVAHHLLTSLLTPLLPMIRDDFGLGYTRSGVLLSAFTLSYGIGQLPAGWLADRVGRRTVITIGICGVALAGLVAGFSRNEVMMAALLAIMGLLGGGYHPSAPPMISASVQPGRQGWALGLHAIGGSISYFLAPLIAIAIAASWGWRSSFIALAIPAIAFGIVFYMRLGRLAEAKTARNEAASASGRTASFRRTLRSLGLFIFLSTFTQAVLISTISFIPLYLVDNFGISEGAGGAFLSVLYSAGLWAAPLGGYLSDRLGRVPVILSVCFFAGVLIYLLNLATLWIGIGAILLAIGMVVYIRMPVSEAYVVGRTTEANMSTVLGIYYFTGMEGGGVLTPLVGYLVDRLGFYSTFTIAGVSVVVVTLVCSIWMWRSRD